MQYFCLISLSYAFHTYLISLYKSHTVGSETLWSWRFILADLHGLFVVGSKELEAVVGARGISSVLPNIEHCKTKETWYSVTILGFIRYRKLDLESSSFRNTWEILCFSWMQIKVQRNGEIMIKLKAPQHRDINWQPNRAASTPFTPTKYKCKVCLWWNRFNSLKKNLYLTMFKAETREMHTFYCADDLLHVTATVKYV